MCFPFVFNNTRKNGGGEKRFQLSKSPDIHGISPLFSPLAYIACFHGLA
jgi:hypothetical protein